MKHAKYLMFLSIQRKTESYISQKKSMSQTSGVCCTLTICKFMSYLSTFIALYVFIILYITCNPGFLCACLYKLDQVKIV